MIIKTVCLYTLQDADAANNNPGLNPLISGYGVSPEGQRQYLTFLARKPDEGFAKGSIYWKIPGSTSCYTLKPGGHRENAALFYAQTLQALPAFEFFNRDCN